MFGGWRDQQTHSPLGCLLREAPDHFLPDRDLLRVRNHGNRAPVGSGRYNGIAPADVGSDRTELDVNASEIAGLTDVELAAQVASLVSEMAAYNHADGAA
jgi:hypothetical protein